MNHSRVEALQAALSSSEADAWLFADFRKRDPIAWSLLGLKDVAPSRRWYYLVPKQGPAVKLVSRVEPTVLDQLPGETRFYGPWPEHQAAFAALFAGYKKVAVQWAENLPTLCVIDAATLDRLRGLGVVPVSSANLVAQFQGRLSEPEMESHRAAGVVVQRIKDEAFARVASELHAGRKITEQLVQQFIVDRFTAEGLLAVGHPPIVAVGAHAANPHYSPEHGPVTEIIAGQPLLIDLWARFDKPDAVVYDITWCGWVGDRATVDARYVELFNLTMKARDAALSCVKENLSAGKTVRGCDVDAACRSVLESAGLGQYFVHRTGHSITQMTHGDGVNMDGFETTDTRPILPRTCFSIEPGLYGVPGNNVGGTTYGMRTEINVLVDEAGQPGVFGAVQQRLLLADVVSGQVKLV